jgi:hypothetical protein
MEKIVSLEAERTKRNIMRGRLITKLPGDPDERLKLATIEKVTRILCLVCLRPPEEVRQVLQTLL